MDGEREGGREVVEPVIIIGTQYQGQTKQNG